MTLKKNICDLHGHIELNILRVMKFLEKYENELISPKKKAELIKTLNLALISVKRATERGKRMEKRLALYYDTITEKWGFKRER